MHYPHLGINFEITLRWCLLLVPSRLGRFFFVASVCSETRFVIPGRWRPSSYFLSFLQRRGLPRQITSWRTPQRDRGFQEEFGEVSQGPHILPPPCLAYQISDVWKSMCRGIQPLQERGKVEEAQELLRLAGRTAL